MKPEDLEVPVGEVGDGEKAKQRLEARYPKLYDCDELVPVKRLITRAKPYWYGLITVKDKE